MTTTPPSVCPPLGRLNLIVGKYVLNFAEKRPICVTLPGPFKFNINIVDASGHKVDLEAGDATVRQKDPCDLTISGDNSVDVKKIAVTVSGEPDPEGDGIYDFWINVVGVGKLDPKVRVVGSDVMLAVKSKEMANTIGDLNLAPQEACKLILALDNSE